MFSSNKNIDSLHKLFMEFKRYIELQKEFVKLDTAEKLTVIFSVVITVAVVLILGALVLLFLTFALAYYIGNALGSLPLGFGIISACILLALFIFYANRNNWVIQPLARFMTKLFICKEDDNNS